MTKSALFAFFAEKFEVKRTEVRDWFDELAALAEKEIKHWVSSRFPCGEAVGAQEQGAYGS